MQRKPPAKASSLYSTAQLGRVYSRVLPDFGSFTVHTMLFPHTIVLVLLAHLSLVLAQTLPFVVTGLLDRYGSAHGHLLLMLSRLVRHQIQAMPSTVEVWSRYLVSQSSFQTTSSSSSQHYLSPLPSSVADSELAPTRFP